MASGDLRIFQKLEVDQKVNELQMLADAHRSQMINNRAALATLPERIRGHEDFLKGLRTDITAAKKIPDEFSMKAGKDTFTERKDAGAAINALVEKNSGSTGRDIGK